MKKKILAVLLCACMVLPIRVKALDIADYKTNDLKGTLDAEKIDYAFSNYEENDKQIPIYLFRGNGCGFCRSFLNFLNSITDEYGQYFKLVSFEVWEDSDNSTLMYDVAEFLGETVQGVPYIIIGDKTFSGYASDYDEAIKTAIKELYESEERYDVFEKYTPTSTKKDENTTTDTGVIVMVTILFVTLGTIIVIAYNKTRFDEISDALEEIQKKKK